ncbi:MAG: EAL domain-containing protein [Aminipila sp.]
MENFNSKRVILLMAACVLIISILTWYATLVDSRLSDETKNTLNEVAKQNVFAIQTEIKSQETSLVEIAERIAGLNEIEIEESIQILNKILERYWFKRMGIALPDGMAYTTDNKTLNLAEREYFIASLNGDSAISSKIIDKTDGKEIIVFSTPIYIDGNVEAVLFATYSTEIMHKILESAAFNDDSYSYIIESDGSIVVGSSEITELNDEQTLYEYLDEFDERNIPYIQNMKKSIKDKKEGIAFVYVDQGKYVQYTPLETNDWYLLNIIPVKSMEKTKSFVMNITYLLFIVIIVLFMMAIGYMIHQEKQKSKELEEIVYIDPITGGYTFQKFCKRADEILKNIKGNSAMILMDIEDFKLINEVYGYEKGNDTLIYISDVWKRWIRPNEIYCRRIADKYLALVFYDHIYELKDRVNSFINNLQNENTELKKEYVFRPKMGIYLIEKNNDDCEAMENYAIIAHSISKKTAGVYYTIYDGKYREEMLANRLLTDEMEFAYKNKEFVAYYQPKFDAKTKDIVGAEALIRWRTREGNLVLPDRFIPLAEKSGFVVKLDEYIFSMVCKQQREWMDKGYNVVPVSVNLSREHLHDTSFIERYKAIREKYKLPFSSVELEITESAMFENMKQFKEVIERLHELQFKILMDDFGTGYSSLTMLRKIPIDVMKLDKSFVDDYQDPRGEKIIDSVIQLAQLMNISVTAEGIETKEQYEFFRKRKCDSIQGYYFAKPLEKEIFEQLVYIKDKK